MQFFSAPLCASAVKSLFRLLVVLAAIAIARPALAHPPLSAIAFIKVTDHHLELTLVHDSLAFALNDTSFAIGDEAMYAILHGPDDDLAAAYEDGRDRFTSQFHLTADGQPLAFKLTDFPTLEKARQWQVENPHERLPIKLDFVVSADLPPGTHAVTFTFPTILAEIVLSIDRPGLETLALPLKAGETSPPIDVSMVTGAEPSPSQPSEGHAAVAWRFTKLGFDHILGPTPGRPWLPQGLDHCFFVLGLFLLVPKFKPVLWQISAFTVAHTLTLTLTSLHIIGLSSRIVEPTIAASIAFIGIENLVTKEVHAWRSAVAFLFGLVHGMGVATAFNEAGFPPGQLVTSLAAFTVGVEAGHLAVLSLAFLALGWFRDKPWYRQRIAIPLSLLIAAIASYWVIQRIFFP